MAAKRRGRWPHHFDEIALPGMHRITLSGLEVESEAFVHPQCRCSRKVPFMRRWQECRLAEPCESKNGRAYGPAVNSPSVPQQPPEY